MYEKDKAMVAQRRRLTNARIGFTIRITQSIPPPLSPGSLASAEAVLLP